MRREQDPCVETAGRARAERTLNMPFMAVTLDVSKFSGWLIDENCRVEKKSMGRGAACGPGNGRAWGGDGASSAQG